MHSLSFYSYKIEKVFDVFLTLKSNVGLFLLVLLFSIALGLMLQIVRSLIFEGLVFRRHKNSSSKSNEDRVDYFNMIVDQQYRYHQFYGAMTVIIPLYFIGIVVSHSLTTFAGIFILVLWVLTIYAAINTYKRMLTYLK